MAGRKGFTLLELAVVSVVIGLLVAVGAVVVPGLMERYRVKAAVGFLAGVREQVYRRAEARGTPTLAQLWTAEGWSLPFTWSQKPPVGQTVTVGWTLCGGDDDCLTVTVQGRLPELDLLCRVGNQAYRTGVARNCTCNVNGTQSVLECVLVP
ncbi:type II secretion system protein [Thermosulfurimonas sp. F29]|uniref:type II secretion system protein n=1 Tax=Thermosulfurimonas sp. F29 TaxID=2867247 RepID=UPI001C831B03|nr:prepilin-type N-terminal cleavage/methylation domain-containing protein [Thermosulfurimonas sp. F29]MBX6423405.1 prepilin-type N-terminal cleavage/methylation domain-containing protein [Thermosulfurimonas sp. F29]